MLNFFEDPEDRESFEFAYGRVPTRADEVRQFRFLQQLKELKRKSDKSHCRGLYTQEQLDLAACMGKELADALIVE